MDNEEIKKVISSNYEITPLSIKKVKNVYKIECLDDNYCLKVIKYEFEHFYFILSAIHYLEKRGFKSIPHIIKTNSGEDYINFYGKFAYLTRWVSGRESNYDNPIEIELVSAKLAEMHVYSEGFNINRKMHPRIGWNKWIKVFDTRKNEIIDFEKRINQKAYKDDFDKMYLENVREEVERAERAINGLINSNYQEVMMKEIFNGGFCHHDVANHNILIDDNKNFNIIDFDYCILDTSIHDLSSLIIRTMKNGKWNDKKCRKIIKSYSDVKEIDDDKIALMKEFIRFPQSFWQIGLQKYWEMQPWNEELFLSKLSKYLEDRNEREYFINSFF